jgi:hypothetical protein
MADAYLGLEPSTLKHAPGGPRRKVGGAVLFRRDELDVWADAHFEGSLRFHTGSTRPQRRSTSGIPTRHRLPQ